jgi:3-dehydroquinate dehydratase
MSREANILQYIEEWHDGFYDSHSQDRATLIRKTVENVLSYHDIAETPENIRNYSRKLEELAKDDTVIIRKNVYSDTWLLELP